MSIAQSEVEKESGEDECDKGSSDCQLCESQAFWEMLPLSPTGRRQQHFCV
jgi:hypothetical protein